MFGSLLAVVGFLGFIISDNMVIKREVLYFNSPRLFSIIRFTFLVDVIATFFMFAAVGVVEIKINDNENKKTEMKEETEKTEFNLLEVV